LITSICLQDTPLLANHAWAQEDSDLITWAAMIPHGGFFSARNKATLESPKDFFNFVKACQALDTAKKNVKSLWLRKIQRWLHRWDHIIWPQIALDRLWK
jgi:hypothetical protein